MPHEGKAEALTRFSASFEGNFEGREANQVGAPPSRFEGGSWGSLRHQPPPRREANKCRPRGRTESPAMSPSGRAYCVPTEFRIENAAISNRNSIIRNRPNLPEFSNFNFSNRNKNSHFGRASSSLRSATALPNSPFLIDSALRLEIALISTKQRPAHVSNR